MWHTNKLLICFAFVYLHSYVCLSEYQSFKKEWKFHKNVLLKYGRHVATDDNSFLLAACSEDTSPTELNCNVTIDTPILPWNESNTHRQTCQLKLVGSEEDNVKHEIRTISSLDRFTKNRAIIVWLEKPVQVSQFNIQNIRVSILNMDKCTTTHLLFPIEKHGLILLGNVVVYSDTFDVTISNKVICENSPTCRITYDVDGNQISKSPFIPFFTIVQTEPVVVSSPIKGFFACGVDANSWRFRAMHVSPTGHGVNLMRATVPDPTKIHYAVSNAHELYGICLMDQKKAYCAQLDQEANIILNATIRIPGHTQDPYWIGVHNLKDGGIILLSGKCSGNKCRKFKITRILGNGGEDKKIDHELNIKCSNVTNNFSVDVAERGDDFCFYFACSFTISMDEKVKNSVKFVSKCVPKSDLTV